MSWDTILDSLQEGIVAVDASGHVISMNQAAEQILGCSRAAAVGAPQDRVFRHGPWIADLVEEVAHGEGGGIRSEGEVASLWGRPVPVRASASPSIDARGQRTGVAVILTDLSLQVGLEADLHRARNLASLGEVVAGLAHEIKNPLSGIRGAVQLLGREVADRVSTADYVGLVIREVDRLTALVERFLQLGARGAMEISGVNIHEIVDHVIALVANEGRDPSVQIVRLFDPSLPQVRGNHDALIQVLLNLIRNGMQALEALPPGRLRELRVSTRMETDFHFSSASLEKSRTRLVRIEIEDSGPGIPEALQPNLFSPFITTKTKGTGLGLAISHRIVSDLGGTIRFESVPGRTVFRVILPMWTGGAA